MTDAAQGQQNYLRPYAGDTTQRSGSFAGQYGQYNNLTPDPNYALSRGFALTGMSDPTREGLAQMPGTGVQQQMQAVNQYYDVIRGSHMGFDPQTYGNNRESTGGVRPELANMAPGTEERGVTAGGNNIQGIANRLAQSYGLAVGRGQIVDERGNFLITPEQLAGASGGAETAATAAVKMQQMATALYNEQRRESQKRAQASAGAAAALAGQRGPGSLLQQQSGALQNLSQVYQAEDYEMYDFSGSIAVEQMNIAQELFKRQEKWMKKKARGQFVGGIIQTLVGAAAGDVSSVGQGLATSSSAAGQTGWF